MFPWLNFSLHFNSNQQQMGGFINRSYTYHLHEVWKGVKDWFTANFKCPWVWWAALHEGLCKKRQPFFLSNRYKSVSVFCSICSVNVLNYTPSFWGANNIQHNILGKNKTQSSTVDWYYLHCTKSCSPQFSLKSHLCHLHDKFTQYCVSIGKENRKKGEYERTHPEFLSSYSSAN